MRRETGKRRGSVSPTMKGRASQIGPELCGSGREVWDEALTGELEGQVLSRDARCAMRPLGGSGLAHILAPLISAPLLEMAKPDLGLAAGHDDGKAAVSFRAGRPEVRCAFAMTVADCSPCR